MLYRKLLYQLTSFRYTPVHPSAFPHLGTKYDNQEAPSSNAVA